MSSEQKFSVPQFVGHNFEYWKFKLFTFLETKNLDHILSQSTDIDPDKLDNWSSDDAKARMYILKAMNDYHVDLIIHESSAKAMIQKLDCMYSKSSTVSKSKLIRNQLTSLRMADDADAMQYLVEFENLIQKLVDFGEKLSPKDVLKYLFLTLPKSYKHIFSNIDPELGEEDAVHLVKAKILAEYDGRVSRRSSKEISDNMSSRSVSREDTDDSSCHRCGKIGHWANHCDLPKSCYLCGDVNHLKIHCYNHWKKGKNCQTAGNGEHVDEILEEAADVLQKMNLNRQPFERDCKPVELRNGNDCNDEVNWVLDSCATHHTVCDEGLFSKCMSLEAPLEVEAANGNVLSTAMVGEVIAIFQAGSTKHVKMLNEVYLVEEFEQNILSVQRLIQFGGSVIFKSSEVELRNAKNELIVSGKKIRNLYVIKCALETEKMTS